MLVVFVKESMFAEAVAAASPAPPIFIIPPIPLLPLNIFDMALTLLPEVGGVLLLFENVGADKRLADSGWSSVSFCTAGATLRGSLLLLLLSTTSSSSSSSIEKLPPILIGVDPVSTEVPIFVSVGAGVGVVDVILTSMVSVLVVLVLFSGSGKSSICIKVSASFIRSWRASSARSISSTDGNDDSLIVFIFVMKLLLESTNDSTP
mmetsp:Transcript_16975/g.19405  ORF Transcript_16975/g.19405 Transcript_16975/m.19405 type:complete len:206 (+) Transcript_16975:859-1476(+)